MFMPRLLHGTVIRLNTVEVANTILASDNPELERALASALRSDLHAFGYLFPGLQTDDANLLPTLKQTRDDLVKLGRTMRDSGPTNSNIPAAYTYFGQFVDHDSTLETTSSGTGQTEGGLAGLLDPNLAPLALEAITDTLRNLRTATLDLDTVYGPPAPRDGDEMELGIVTALGNQPVPGARPERAQDDPFQDLPREPRSTVDEHDRAALIGDPRNDENLIVAQLHVAFLRAHNELVRQGKGFAQAQRLLRQHYQHIVIHDFLRRRVADAHIVDDILQHGNKFYKPGQRSFFLPLEYTVAAFRFGHTMVRGAYNFNLNFGFGRPGGPASLARLFSFTALKGQLFPPPEEVPPPPDEGFPTLPENWIIEWENIIDAGGGVPFNFTSRLDTQLVEPLFHLRNLTGEEELDDGARLAVRNLLRGYLLRMPTGQAVATALGRAPLTPAQLEAVADQVTAPDGAEKQVDVLRNVGFLERTPLWYYILAEAAAPSEAAPGEAAGGGGQRLGPVGSTIVAEVLIGLVRRSKDSILGRAHWQPSLPSAQPGTFELVDLLRFAKVLP
jgi:Animal haem peroxidase